MPMADRTSALRLALNRAASPVQSFAEDSHGRLTLLGSRWKLELLESGGYGWAEYWWLAFLLAQHSSAILGKRHRVYWSPQGRAWMVRRAFCLQRERIDVGE